MSDRFLELPNSLDGTAYMAAAQHWEREETFPLVWDLQAMRWLQDNVQGTPVVLEAHMEQYRWGGRMANYTGLPTVIGWPWHQTQQRFDYRHRIYERADDVRLAYETTDMDTATRLMERYGVSYVVVGTWKGLTTVRQDCTSLTGWQKTACSARYTRTKRHRFFASNFHKAIY